MRAHFRNGSIPVPARIFLDTTILQLLHQYGTFIFENELIPTDDNIYTLRNGVKHIEALQWIFLVNTRALFEFMITRKSIEEVANKNETSYLSWAFDVADHTAVCLEEAGGLSGEGVKLSKVISESDSFNYLGEGDRELVHDALLLECDAFHTMDLKLASHTEHIEDKTGLAILTPIEYWKILEPYAALWI